MRHLLGISTTVVGDLDGVGGVAAFVFVSVANLHEVLLDIGTEEGHELLVLWSESSLEPERGELVHVVLGINTEVVLFVVSEVHSGGQFLGFRAIFVLVLDFVLHKHAVLS